MPNMLLMSKDTVVLEINMDEGVYNILNDERLPFQLRGKLRRIPDFSEIKSRYDDVQRTIAINKCRDAVISYLASRVLPLSRENAKKVYNLFGFSQLQDDISKARIALVCRAASLQDDFWIKLDNEACTWSDVNLRENSLSEIVAQVSLHGSSLSITGRPSTPELTGQGAYAKAWMREADGLYLHKLGANGSTESRIEVMVSGLLDACNVAHVTYEASTSTPSNESTSVYTCKCKCMTNDRLSILPGMDYISYCNVNNNDYLTDMYQIDAPALYKMAIVDYLISNRDRHGLNWGFYYNPYTMTILGCHPLFDHNNAFDIQLMQDKDAKYLFDDRYTMRQAAKRAMQNVDFHFTREITRADFLTDRQYQSFKDRADELGIPVVSGLPQDAYRQQALQLFIDTGRPDLLEDFLTTLPSVDCDLMAAFTAYCTIKNIQ